MKTRTMLPACAALLLGMGASAAFGASLLENLEACAAHADDAARLRCYDEQMAALGVRKNVAAAAVAPAPATPPAPAPTPAKPAASPPVAVAAVTAPAPKPAAQPAAPPVPSDYGLPREAPKKESFSARVRSVSERAHGEISVELENGQVWAQTEKRSTFRVEPGETVTIRPGRLGSYFLLTESKLSARVTRIR